MEYKRYIHHSGMLRVNRPSTWTVREYPTDPRAKVEFSDQTDRGVTARLIATPAKGETLVDVLPDFEERRAQMLALGGEVSFADVVIRGVKAKRLTVRYATAQQILYLFVEADMYCNFSFECSHKHFQRCWPTFEAILLSAEFRLPPSMHPKDERNRLAASRIRRAELCLKHGNITLAREAVREGLEFDPENQALIELYAKVECVVREEHSGGTRTNPLTRYLVLWRFATAAPALVALVALDFSGRWRWIAPILIALPVLDLRRQLQIWVAHVRAFGFPSARALRTMLRLDALRGYDALAERIGSTPRGPMWEPAVLTLLTGGALGTIAYLSGWSAPLYGSSVCAMLVAKAILRRTRPPAALLLGGSGSEVTLLHQTINEAIKPLEAVSLLRHTRTAPMVDDRLLFLNFRTGRDADWHKMVAALVPISGLVILDLRVPSDAVRIEKEICRDIPDKLRLFVVSNTPESGFLDSQCFSPHEVARPISEHLKHRHFAGA